MRPTGATESVETTETTGTAEIAGAAEPDPPYDLHNSLFHAAPWVDAVESTFGLRTDRFEPPGEPGGVAHYSLVDDIRGRRIVATPFGDFCEPAISTIAGWNEYTAHLRDFDCPVTIRPFANPIALADSTFDIRGGLLWHGVDLSGGADAVFDGVGTKIRTKIRRPAKLGVTFRESSSAADVAAMHAMHVSLRKSKYSMLAQPKRFFDALHANFGDDMVVVFAEVDGEPVAGMTFFAWNGVWYYKFSASYENSVRPNPALMMHSIRVACERGLRFLDMGRSDADQPGLLDFKEQFEPQVRSLSTLHWSPAGHADPRGAQAGATLGQLTEVLTQPSVPDSAAAAAGDLLYRFFA